LISIPNDSIDGVVNINNVAGVEVTQASKPIAITPGGTRFLAVRAKM